MKSIWFDYKEGVSLFERAYREIPDYEEGLDGVIRIYSGYGSSFVKIVRVDEIIQIFGVPFIIKKSRKDGTD